MTLSERVAAEIRAEMARQRRSPHSLETQLGWSHLYLTRRLTGRSAIKLDDVEAIAKALEVPVTAFFNFPDHNGVGIGDRMRARVEVRRPGSSDRPRLAVAV